MREDGVGVVAGAGTEVLAAGVLREKASDGVGNFLVEDMLKEVLKCWRKKLGTVELLLLKLLFLL
jgi:hypothetical protein